MELLYNRSIIPEEKPLLFLVTTQKHSKGVVENITIHDLLHKQKRSLVLILSGRVTSAIIYHQLSFFLRIYDYEDDKVTK